jgi:hypothetical protein
MHRLVCAVSTAGLLAACAPLIRHSSPAAVTPEQSTWKARAVFDSAVQAGDTARMAALFASGAFVIAATGDTIPAHDALPLYLTAMGRDRGEVRFSWGREGTFEACIGGGRERLVYTARLTRPDGSSSGVTGRVAVFWTSDSSGTLKIAWIAFPQKEMARELSRTECPSVDAFVWQSWRWAVSLYPVPALGRGGVQQSFESVLRERGWVDQDCSCANPAPVYTPISDWTILAPPGLITVQRHLEGRWVAELAAGRSPLGTTLGAHFFPNRDYAQVRLWYSGVYMGALISFERWPFQIGAGPAIQAAHWRMRDSVVPYSTGGNPSFQDTRWSSTTFGLTGDVRYNMLVSPRSFLTFRGQYRAFLRTKTPASPNFPAAALTEGGALFAVGVGLFR